MRVGIVGCGQLARMLALAGWPMGLSFAFLAGSDDDAAPVAGLGEVVRREPGLDAKQIYTDLGSPDVITVEKEQVDADLLRQLQQFCPVHPDPEIVHVCQHRGREKRFVSEQGVGTAPYGEAADAAQLRSIVAELGLPLIIKSFEQGYDGQNQWRLNTVADCEPFFQNEQSLPPSVVEKRIAFSREVSLLVVRDQSGDVRLYPPAENLHRDGILLTSKAPAPDCDDALLSELSGIGQRLMAAWDYVGVLAIECFVTDEGVLVNELAPRVHNSGHWTQQGAATCQFENHLRAITGVGLGSTECHTPTAMVNLLGVELPASVASLPNVHTHLYNKSLKPRRKVGHVNLLADRSGQLPEQMSTVLAQIYPDQLADQGS